MSTAIRLHDFRNTSLQRVTRCGELLLHLENWTSFACSGLGLGHMDTFPRPWIDKGRLGKTVRREPVRPRISHVAFLYTGT